MTRAAINAQRNAPCPCGSGKKYKKCCLGKKAVVPASSNPQLQLAMQHHGAGHLAEAEALYRQVLAREPEHPEALNGLGVLAYQLGHHDVALDLIGWAIKINDTDPGQYNNLGLVCHALGRFEEAVSYYQKAISLKADYFVAYSNLATTLGSQGRFEEVTAYLQKALAIRPDQTELLYNLGNNYTDQNMLDEAIACYQKVLSIKPYYSEAHYNLGTALLNLDKMEEARRCFQRAIQIDPKNAQACYNLGYVLKKLGHYDDAIEYLHKSLTLNSRNGGALSNLGNALLSLGRPEEALAYVDRALAIQPDLVVAQNNKLFILNYLPSILPEALLAAHRSYADRIETPLKPHWPMHGNDRDPARRLKVGYVSADLRLHSVAYFLEPLLAHHDRREVEVYCYYNNTLEDAVTVRLKGYADHWLVCKGLTDEQLAARIQADGIDILVDLAGHTADNRLPVFARKPAPVQVSYLGYPATTGLSAIDYRLVTADTDPPGAEAWHSERLYRLPRSLWCYRPAPAMPAVIAETPARRQGFITFGSMNNIAKVSEPAVVLWSRLLQAVPGSRLVLTNVAAGTAQRRIGERFAAQGIDAGAAYAARQAAGGGVLRAAERHRHRAGPVSVHGHHHHLRESVDGGAGGDADRRDERGALGVCVAQGHWIGRTGGGR